MRGVCVFSVVAVICLLFDPAVLKVSASTTSSEVVVTNSTATALNTTEADFSVTATGDATLSTPTTLLSSDVSQNNNLSTQNDPGTGTTTTATTTKEPTGQAQASAGSDDEVAFVAGFVGGTVLLILCLAAVGVCIRRCRRQPADDKPKEVSTDPSEVPTLITGTVRVRERINESMRVVAPSF